MSRAVLLSNAETDPRASRASNQPGTVSLGTVADGNPVGGLDAVYSVLTLPVGFGGGEIDLPHKLGRVPSLVSCLMQEGGGFASVRSTSRDRWTASGVRVTVALVTGSLDNLRLVFLIGG